MSRVSFFVRHPRLLRWAIDNWFRGYGFSPVQRHRCCDHTTPGHYQGCPRTENVDSPGGSR